MALGSAVGGLAKGIAQGMRLGSDMQDAEARRGLIGLQTDNARIQLDNEKQYQEISKQLAAEINGFNQNPNRDNPDVIDAHYANVGSMLKQQAIIAKKDVMAVDDAIDRKRKDRYQESIFAATKLLQTNPEAGIEALKPIYNKMFKDGNTLVGGAYNPDTNQIDLRYVNKDGVEGVKSFDRDKFATNILPMALNVADAARLQIKADEDEKGRQFTASEGDKNRGVTVSEGDKNRGVKVSEGEKDRQSAERRTKIGADAQIESAKVSQDGRRTTAANTRDDKDYDDFQSQINDALGWNKNNLLTRPEDLDKRNKDAALMTGIFTTTRDVGGKKLSAYEAAQLVKGIQGSKAKITEKDGYTIVDVNGVRGILPK